MDDNYVSKKFKESLTKLNEQIEKSKAVQSKFITYSKGYQDALKTEIELLEQKKELLQSEEGLSLYKQ